MNVVILAGGLGTRLEEETITKPKPMVEIGGRPILWHIMKHYAFHGFNEFRIATGYKGEEIRQYFFNVNGMNPVSKDSTHEGGVLKLATPPWVVQTVDTGQKTCTGGRLKRLEFLRSQGTFMVTYGDGVSNVDLKDLLRFHRSYGRMATVTAVHPPARFGALTLSGDQVVQFSEKSQIHEGWIHGGFMVFEPSVIDEIEGDETILESDVLEHLADQGQLMAYRHNGFWQCMDTLREKRILEQLWRSRNAPWKVW